LACALLVSGCGILARLGAGEDDKPEGWTPTGIPVEGALDIPAIRDKFGVPKTVTGTAAVNAAFGELHAYIQAGGLDDPATSVIRLGDYIDLEGGLAVEAYNGEGAFSHDAAKAVEAVTNQGEPWGTLCRLIVVGINPFRTAEPEDGSGYHYQGEGEPPAHVVFHFQNLPVVRRMNPTDDSSGGYAMSEMRRYLVPVGDDSGSGRFLAGLVKAGVPESVLWAPARALAQNDTEIGVVSDRLWLPTEQEMFENGTSLDSSSYSYGPFAAAVETAENQARLEFYTDNFSRLKAWPGDKPFSFSENISRVAVPEPIPVSLYPDMGMNVGHAYWEASHRNKGWSGFCFVALSGIAYAVNSTVIGVAPAFCVQ
jgi:hypothetical protein